MLRISLVLIVLGITQIAIGQDCTVYFPMEEGTTFEMTSYNKKGKEESRGVTTITERTVSGEDLSIMAKTKIYSDKKNEDPISMDYEAKCEDGVFKLNMFSGFSTEQAGSGMIEVDGDFLDIPANPRAGQKLDDKTIILKIAPNEDTGESLINMKYHIVDREVEAIEDVTTPAGTFNCIKLSYTMNFKFIFSQTFKIKEWYAEGVGLVRSETYNKKDKLDSYQELTAFDH